MIRTEVLRISDMESGVHYIQPYATRQWAANRRTARLARIKFPILRHIAVHGYDLYPGVRANAGFEKHFQYGVNVAVGINGVGKTTLLNMVMRSLLGPWDPSKAEADEPGRKQSGLTFRSKFPFFAQRVTDGAEEAEIAATFQFGTDEVTICRRLKNLRPKWYTLNGFRVDQPSEEEIFGHLCKLSGVSESIAYDEQRHYEFDFLVRNLIFFLEGKVSLVWRPAGQFVALRILFVDEELSQKIAKSRNDLLALDSAYRNFRWQAGSAEKRLHEELKKEATPALVKRRELVVREIKDAEDSFEITKHELIEIEKLIEQSGPALLLQRHNVMKASERATRAEADHYHAAFHSIRSPADVYIEAILAEEGCKVCGTGTPKVRERAAALLEAHQCPVCESHIDMPVEAEGLVARRLEELLGAQKALQACQLQLREMEEKHRQLTASYDELVMACGRLTEVIRAKRAELIQIEATFPDQEQMSELQKERDFFEARIKGYKAELEKTARFHEELVISASARIDEVRGQLIQAFQHYANEFLIEECQLVFDMRRGRVAQEDPEIEWPTFRVQMTSGDQGPPMLRDGDEQVSESQREFIELAFRMALLEVASTDQPSMLVVETPEASLDAPFVERAGALIREFLGKHEQNVLLASCNLNGERMIPALLGTDNLEHPSPLTRVDRLRHILRLTDIARLPRAYAKFKDHYDAVFEEALEGAGYP